MEIIRSDITKVHVDAIVNAASAVVITDVWAKAKASWIVEI